MSRTMWTSVAGVLLAIGCGSKGTTPDAMPGVPDAAPCQGLACFQVECPAGEATTVSGTVYAPNGTLPLYNATVYVPTTEVAAFTDTLTCDRCADAPSGNPLVQATTDTEGRFVLTNVPATGDVPLVIQIGRWRRQVVVPSVPACVDTPLDAGTTRLPATQAEGDIPRIALSTGQADALECLLRKIGLDDSEFTNPGGGGRINLFDGANGASRYNTALGGATFPESSSSLWDATASLSNYDVVLLSCEGSQNLGDKPEASRDAMAEYAGLGGRVFASHWHNAWIEHGPGQFADVGTWSNRSDLNDITADLDTSFPRGVDLADWLVNVGASTTSGQIPLTAAQHTLDAIDGGLAQRWIYKDVTANGAPSVQYFSFTTPLEQDEANRCGRVVFSDIHVSSGDRSRNGTPFPDDCTTTDLSPQEKVLAFMLFDISSCIEAPLD
ncbi:MAG: hypothetical protein R2939_09465 [Kofleriaceae bacterium]